MAKQLIQDKRKLPQSFVLCIFLAFSAFFFFFKSYNFPENNPLSLSLCVCVFAYLTWMEVTRICFGEFVEALYSEKRNGENMGNKGKYNSSRVMDAKRSILFKVTYKS